MDNTEQNGLIIIPAEKWGLFSSINNYPICIERGHDWMNFFIDDGQENSLKIVRCCRRCGLQNIRSGKWDGGYRENDNRIQSFYDAELDKTSNDGDYNKARGVIPWKEGDELPEDVIRRMRDV